MTASEKLRAPRAAAPTRLGAAFLNLEGTLILGSVPISRARTALAAGVVPAAALTRDLRHRVSFLVKGSSGRDSAAAREGVRPVVTGRRARDVEVLRDHGMPSLAESISPAMREVLDEHAAAGRACIVLTDRPTETVSQLVTAAGLELVAGATVGVEGAGRDGGRATKPPFIPEGKVEVMRRIADERGYDLATSYAYADSIKDLPMLEAVGHPVAVNPEPRLREVAEQRGWPIVETGRLPRVDSSARSWAKLGQRAAAGTVGWLVALGTGPVEAVVDLDGFPRDDGVDDGGGPADPFAAGEVHLAAAP